MGAKLLDLRIICGAKTKDGLYVGAIDFDVKNLPEEVIAKGREALKHMPITQTEQTPSGGFHYIYYSVEKPKSVSGYHNVCGLEVIGEGKLCIMAPSEGYKRLNDNTPTIINGSLNEVFEAVLQKVGIQNRTANWFNVESFEGKYRGPTPPCIRGLLKGVSEGLRNEAGIRIASYLLNFKGVPLQRALPKIFFWNKLNKHLCRRKKLEILLILLKKADTCSDAKTAF